jgi:hypothetical protein
MSMFKVILSWAGIVILGLAHGVLEDLMFIRVLVEYVPPSWDLTGNLFFIFTVPLAQLMTLACWIVARTAFLLFAQNPVGDIAIYLAWITLWCSLVGLYARSKNQAAD